MNSIDMWRRHGKSRQGDGEVDEIRGTIYMKGALWLLDSLRSSTALFRSQLVCEEDGLDIFIASERLEVLIPERN